MNKKLIALVLVLAMALTFVLSSCNNTEKELTEQANNDHKEYVKTVSTNAVDAAAESIKPLKTLNDIKESCLITLDMGDFEGIEIKSIVAQILDKKAYLKVLAGGEDEGKEATLYFEDDSVIVDTEKAGTDKPGVYKIKAQDLVALMGKTLSGFGFGSFVASDVEVNESTPEKILDILKNDIATTVTTEKVEVYGKTVKCIVSEIVINNELITKIIRDIFPVIKDSLGENIGDITADTIVDAFNSIGLDISGKLRTEVEADSGLPVRAYVDLAVVSKEESESDQQKTALFIADDDDDDDYFGDDDDDDYDYDYDYDYDDDTYTTGGLGFDPSMLSMLGNIKISCVVNFPEKCSLLNSADLTLKVTIGDEGSSTTVSAAIKWSAEDSADAFKGKLKIELPAILTDNSNITINFDYDKKTKEFHAYYGDEFDLKLKLEYTDSEIDVTLISVTLDDKTIDLKNIHANIKSSNDFPAFPTNYTEVSGEDIDDIIG